MYMHHNNMYLLIKQIRVIINFASTDHKISDTPLVSTPYCLIWQLSMSTVIHIHVHSGTSNKRPYDKGTSISWTTSLQRTLPLSPKYICNTLSTSEKRTASLQGTQWLVPKCPLLGGPLSKQVGYSHNSAINIHKYTYYMYVMYTWQMYNMADYNHTYCTCTCTYNNVK